MLKSSLRKALSNSRLRHLLPVKIVRKVNTRDLTWIVDILVENLDNSATTVRFMVVDSGVGISQERQKNIFNLFEKSITNSLSDSLKKKTCTVTF